MPTSRRGISRALDRALPARQASLRRLLVALACAAVAALPVVALAQEPRAWAGATEPDRAPLRIAAALPATDSDAEAAAPAKLIRTRNLLDTLHSVGCVTVPLV